MSSFDLNLSKPKIMIVEDEKLTRESLAKIVECSFEGVITAENGRDGLDLFHLSKPNVIISDITMPEMCGVEMVQKIQATGHNPMVVIITSFDTTEYEGLLKGIKVFKVIQKPFRLETIEELLSEIKDMSS